MRIVRCHALRAILGSCACLLFQSTVHGATAHLVRDINAQNIAVSSYPTDYVNLGPRSYLAANDGIHSFQAWLSDGTAAGTFNWAEHCPAISGTLQQQVVTAGSRFFIQAYDSFHGTTICVTDGTAQGSRALTAIPAASGVNPSMLGALGGKLVFSLFNTATSERDLWISDGTDGGTSRVQSAAGDAFSVGAHRIVGQRLYFLSSVASGGTQPWVSDGTSGGTARLAQIPNGVQDTAAQFIVRAGNYLVFALTTADIGRELWRIDPGTDAVAQITDIAPGADSAIGNITFATVGAIAVFTASPTGDGVLDLWRTDGTAAGTFSISTVVPATFSASPFFGSAGMTFVLFYVHGAGGLELWGTDGSAAGTRRLVASGVASEGIYEIGGHYYFSASSSGSAQVWTTDGTPASTRVLNNLPGSVTPAAEIAGDGVTLYVRSANLDGLSGRIFRYDLGTSSATLLKSYTFGDRSLHPGVFGFAQGRLYFDDEDPLHGRELWLSDGTTGGTALFKNFAAGLRSLEVARTHAGARRRPGPIR